MDMTSVNNLHPRVLRYTLLIVLLFLNLTSSTSAIDETREISSSVAARNDRGEVALILYDFNPEDSEHRKSFSLFLNVAALKDPTSKYIFIIPDSVTNVLSLPLLPPWAQYLKSASPCYWTRFGEALEFQAKEIEKFHYFVFLGSNVRGPFITPAVQRYMTWWGALTHLIDDNVKLSGPAVSCESSNFDEEITMPFVDPRCFATDKEGLAAIREAGVLATCHGDTPELSRKVGGAAMSRAVMGFGFNLGSLLARHHRVDWLNPDVHTCNGGLSPFGEFQNDGVSVSPYEAVFVPSPDEQLTESGTYEFREPITSLQLRLRSLWKLHAEIAPVASDCFGGKDIESGLTTKGLETKSDSNSKKDNIGDARKYFFSRLSGQTDIDSADNNSGGGSDATSSTAKCSPAPPVRAPYSEESLWAEIWNSVVVSSNAVDINHGGKSSSLSSSTAEAGAATNTTTSPATTSTAATSAAARRMQLISEDLLTSPKGSIIRTLAVVRQLVWKRFCFDVDYFRLKNPDVASLGAIDTWEFFVYIGQFEGRPFRYRCSLLDAISKVQLS